MFLPRCKDVLPLDQKLGLNKSCQGMWDIERVSHFTAEITDLRCKAGRSIMIWISGGKLCHCFEEKLREPAELQQ